MDVHSEFGEGGWGSGMGGSQNFKSKKSFCIMYLDFFFFSFFSFCLNCWLDNGVFFIGFVMEIS